MPALTLDGSSRQRLTNALVELHKDLLGRGPVDTRCTATEDAIFCLLRGGFSRDERLLVKAGRAEAVVARRRAVADAMSERFTAAVAEIVGRPVLSHLSDCDPVQEVCSEVFLLGEPGGELDLGSQEEGMTAQGRQARRRAETLVEMSKSLQRKAAEQQRDGR